MIEIISNEIITNLRLIDLMPPLLSFAESLDFLFPHFVRTLCLPQNVSKFVSCFFSLQHHLPC